MRFSKSGFFHESIVPRFTPLNIFENIFVFAEIFTKVVFFQSNFRVTIPGNCNISRYCYRFRVTILWNWKYPGIVTRKLTQHFCLLVNFQVLIPGSWKFSNFWVLLPGNSQFLSNSTQKLENFWVSIIENWSNFE